MSKYKKRNPRKLHDYRSARLKARLSFDEGYAEKPVYSIKGWVSEKQKGLDMMELIENNFNITLMDREEDMKNKQKEFLEEMKDLSTGEKEVSPRDKWTRDEKGNLVSPWSIHAVKK